MLDKTIIFVIDYEAEEKKTSILCNVQGLQ